MQMTFSQSQIDMFLNTHSIIKAFPQGQEIQHNWGRVPQVKPVLPIFWLARPQDFFPVPLPRFFPVENEGYLSLPGQYFTPVVMQYNTGFVIQCVLYTKQNFQALGSTYNAVREPRQELHPVLAFFCVHVIRCKI